MLSSRDDNNTGPVHIVTEDNLKPLLIIAAAALAWLLSASWILVVAAVLATIAALVTVDSGIRSHRNRRSPIQTQPDPPRS